MLQTEHQGPGDGTRSYFVTGERLVLTIRASVDSCTNAIVKSVLGIFGALSDLRLDLKEQLELDVQCD